MRTSRREIRPGAPCYVIAELSHNHQGDGSMALELIRQAAKAGANAVKFQKRDNSTLYSTGYYNKQYYGKNSFGATYGEHREFLEPKKDWLVKANELAHSLHLDFMMTVFDLASLAFCEENLDVDAYKIQSADLTFDPLICAVAGAGKPFFISCGASSLTEIRHAYDLCLSLSNDFCLMYTVSAYPTPADKLNLARIQQLKSVLGTQHIGYSCHYAGITPSLYARMLGCIAIEKHFTLDKSQKGPDHALSVTPAELIELIEAVHEADMMTGHRWQQDSEVEPHQLDARHKMGKSPVLAKDVDAGERIDPEDVLYISPAEGLSPAEMKDFFGKPVAAALKKGSYLQRQHFS